MQIHLNKSTLDLLPMNRFFTWLGNPPDKYPYRSGQEHYRLLAYLSWLFKNVCFADIGTNTGASAVALADNPSNKVYSFDIIERIKFLDSPTDPRRSRYSEIDFICGDFFNYWPHWFYSPVILLDIDHSGEIERKFIDKLEAYQYRGILILDDIHWTFPGMTKLWKEINLPKIDATAYGHASGTGIINFAEHEFILE